MPSVVFDYRKDENQFPIINPIRINGKLKTTASMYFEFDENDRVISRKRHDWYRLKKPKLNDPKFMVKYLEYKRNKRKKRKFEASFVPIEQDYDFDVQISGRYTKNGKIQGIYKDCGKFGYDGKLDPKLYMTIEREYDYHKIYCKRQNCPICFRTHGAIRGKSVASKLWKIAKNNNYRLRHWTVNYREKDGIPIPPPKTFKEIKQLEDKFKKILKKYHSSRLDGNLGYTLTIHPYSGVKNCTKCGSVIKGIKNIKLCPECKKKGVFHAKFENPRWVQGWHWHLITNLYSENLNLLSYELAQEGFQLQNLSKGERYPRRYITSQEMLSRILSYEFSHAMYIPFKPRDVCRFLGQFHHGKYETIKEFLDVPKLDSKGNYYFRIKVNNFKNTGIVAKFDTNEEVYMDENGKIEIKYERILIYTKVRLKTDKEMKRQYSHSGSRKKEKIEV